MLFILVSLYKLFFVHELDVTNAFVNGVLAEKECIEQHECSILYKNENKRCKLVKSLYELKQTPNQWFEKFDLVILWYGFERYCKKKGIYLKYINEYIWCANLSTCRWCAYYVKKY